MSEYCEYLEGGVQQIMRHRLSAATPPSADDDVSSNSRVPCCSVGRQKLYISGTRQRETAWLLSCPCVRLKTERCGPGVLSCNHAFRQKLDAPVSSTPVV